MASVSTLADSLSRNFLFTSFGRLTCYWRCGTGRVYNIKLRTISAELVRKYSQILEYLEFSLEDLLHEMQVALFDVVRYSESLPWRRRLFSAILSNHFINLDFQASEKKFFAQSSQRLAKASPSPFPEGCGHTFCLPHRVVRSLQAGHKRPVQWLVGVALVCGRWVLVAIWPLSNLKCEISELIA